MTETKPQPGNQEPVESGFDNSPSEIRAESGSTAQSHDNHEAKPPESELLPEQNSSDERRGPCQTTSENDSPTKGAPSDGRHEPEVLVETVGADESDDDENLVEIEKSHEQPALTLKEAAVVLGKSMRALERSLHGKWGNRLPDGWTAKKTMVDGVEEWRVYPPPGLNFKIDHLLSEIRKSSNNGRKSLTEEFLDYFKPEHGPPPKTNRSIWNKPANELVLGRPLEVVQLLRELAVAQKALADEHRAHLEDLKLLSEAQSTMRLLEVNQTETARLKEDLVAAQSDLLELKRRYDALVNMPWWKRLFARRP